MIAAGKPDFIKTFVLFYGTPRAEGLDAEVLAAIVKRAHAAGIRVTSHIETAADFRIAVDAGVDEINHLPIPRGPDLSPYVINEATAKLAAKKGVTVVTTVRPIRMPGMPERTIPAKVIANELQNVATLRNAGVTISPTSPGSRCA